MRCGFSDVSVEYSEYLARFLLSGLSELLVSQLCAVFRLSIQLIAFGGCCRLSHLLDSHPVNIIVLNQRLWGTAMQLSEAPFLSSSTPVIYLVDSSCLSKLCLQCAGPRQPCLLGPDHPVPQSGKFLQAEHRADQRALSCIFPPSGIRVLYCLSSNI